MAEAVDTAPMAVESGAAPAAAAAPSGPQFTHVAELNYHNDWVTCLQVASNKDESILVSGSRDKTLLKWKVEGVVEGKYAVPVRRLGGHNHFISDVALADEGKYAVSSSWDGTLRLWDLSNGESVQSFKGHKGSVLSVSVSPENAHIVSGGRDRTIKFWNIRGRCIFTTTDAKAHSDWVSCVRFAPRPKMPFFISASWDKLVKVWGYKERVALQTNFIGHTGFINVVTVSPDGSLCASGGKDGIALLWDLRNRRLLTRLQAGDVINALAFSPMRYWLAVATPSAVVVWDLRRKTIFGELNVDRSSGEETTASKLRKGARNQCISLTWSSDGAGLYCGCTDGSIHVFHASMAA